MSEQDAPTSVLESKERFVWVKKAISQLDPHTIKTTRLN